MRKQGVTLAITAAVVAAMVAPQVAQAGNKEWATAGKILAGAAVIHVLTDNGGSHHREVIVERRYDYSPRYSSRYSRDSQCRTPQRYERHVRHRASSPPRDYCGTCRHERSACSCGPVVIDIGDSKRLFQPRIRGHVSYLQVWDSCRRDWRTIGTRDSIW